MPSADETPTPQFLAAANALIESLERLENDPETLQIVALRLRNMVLSQRQWCNRAALRRTEPATSEPSPQDALLKRLEQAQERCHALLQRSGASIQGEA